MVMNFPSRKKKSRGRRSVNPLEETPGLREIIRDNIVITGIAVIFTILGLLLFGNFAFEFLYTYSFDNVNIEAISPEDLATDLDIGTISFGSSVLEQFLSAFFTIVIILILPDAYYFTTVLSRTIRLVYLGIIGTVIVYIFVYWFLSLIFNFKINWTTTTISLLFSSSITLIFTFFYIPNNDQFIELFVDRLSALLDSRELFREGPIYALDMVYLYYSGFIIGIFVHLGSSIVIQRSLRNL